MKYDRFKLEELITAVYQTGEDLEVVMRTYMDREKNPRECTIMNMITGIKALHEARCDILFQCMEKLIKQGDLK